MLKEWKRKKGLGIFSKVLMGYMVIILIVLAMACGITYNLVRNYIIQTNETELLQKAIYIAGGQHRAPDWQEMRKYQNLLDAEIVFVRTDYMAVQSPTRPGVMPKRASKDAETGLAYTEIISNMDQQIINSIFSGNGVAGVEKVDFLTAQIVYAGTPVSSSQGELLGAIMLFRLVEDIDAMWLRIAFFLLLAAVCAMLVAIAFAAVFTKSLTRPLFEINSAAKHMALGDYTRRVPIYNNDELGELGETLNVLSSRLRVVINSLQNEKSKLEQILLSLGEGIVAFDRDGRLFHYNQAALELLEITDWAERGSDDSENQKRHITGMLSVCMDSGERETATYTNASGRAITALASPIRSAEKQIIGAVCLLRDVSEEQRLEQLRREYVANVSHELRTPLTGIRGMVEPLIDGMLETEAEKHDCYQVIYRETMRLQKLISEMLDMSRLQDGRAEVCLEALELCAVVESAAMSAKHLADDAGIDLRICLESPITCMGNEDRIIQVMIILIDNAVSFTPKGGRITVSARAENGKARVSVCDTGAGIEPQHLPYIWERFYKADKSRMRTTGTGLGLAIAKRAVELMGGEISVKTEAGKGSEFTFTLNLVV